MERKAWRNHYRAVEATRVLYEFLWNQFCAQFLEAVKLDLRGDREGSATSLLVFDHAMSRFFQGLHPFMPHLTEELSERMGYLAKGEFLMSTELPKEPLLAEVPERAGRAKSIYETAGRLRNLKAEYNLATNKEVRFVVRNGAEWLSEEADVLALLVGAAGIEFDDAVEVATGTPVVLTDLGEFVMPLEGLIDIEAEKARLAKEISKTEVEVEKCLRKLQNPKFVDNAKPEVVATEKERHEAWLTKLENLRELHKALGE